MKTVPVTLGHGFEQQMLTALQIGESPTAGYGRHHTPHGTDYGVRSLQSPQTPEYRSRSALSSRLRRFTGEPADKTLPFSCFHDPVRTCAGHLEITMPNPTLDFARVSRTDIRRTIYILLQVREFT